MNTTKAAEQMEMPTSATIIHQTSSSSACRVCSTVQSQRGRRRRRRRQSFRNQSPAEILPQDLLYPRLGIVRALDGLADVPVELLGHVGAVNLAKEVLHRKTKGDGGTVDDVAEVGEGVGDLNYVAEGERL